MSLYKMLHLSLMNQLIMLLTVSTILMPRSSWFHFARRRTFALLFLEALEWRQTRQDFRSGTFLMSSMIVWFKGWEENCSKKASKVESKSHFPMNKHKNNSSHLTRNRKKIQIHSEYSTTTESGSSLCWEQCLPFWEWPLLVMYCVT